MKVLLLLLFCTSASAYPTAKEMNVASKNHELTNAFKQIEIATRNGECVASDVLVRDKTRKILVGLGYTVYRATGDTFITTIQWCDKS